MLRLAFSLPRTCSDLRGRKWDAGASPIGAYLLDSKFALCPSHHCIKTMQVSRAMPRDSRSERLISGLDLVRFAYSASHWPRKSKTRGKCAALIGAQHFRAGLTSD